MKKNLLSIVILALLIVNLVLTSIMMFSVMSTNKKTASVVTSIASILELELEGEEEEAVAVSMEDTAVYNVSNDLTILLRKSTALDENGQAVAESKDHYAMVAVSFSMDTTHEGYTTYGATIAEKESLLIGVVTEVVSQYSAEEIQPKSEEIKEKILKGVQDLFGSEFIYDVTFSKLIVQ